MTKTISIAHNRSLHRQKQVLIGTLLLVDVIMIGAALLSAWYLRIGSGWLRHNAPADFWEYVGMILFSILIFLPLFTLIGLYNFANLMGGPQEYGLVVRGCSYGVLALIMASFLLRAEAISRGWLLISWLLCILFVGSTRFLCRRFFYWLRKRHGWLANSILIVGVSDHTLALAAQLSVKDSSQEVVGFLDEFLPVGTHVLGNLTVLGTPLRVHELASQHKVQQVILSSNAVTWETFQEIIAGAGLTNGFELCLSPGFFEILTSNVRVFHKSFVPLLAVEQARLVGIDRLLKMIFDYSLGFLLFILLFPVMLALTLAILIVDGRPVFERYPVLGLKGKRFWTTKFKTGLQGRRDRNFTRVYSPELMEDTNPGSHMGKFLFRTGLDKLPQLVDVLRGCMSLVGPRTTAEDRQKDYHPSLVTVKPGWTGLWAVRTVQNPDDELRLTLFYIRNWTIWLDLQVLFQTARLALFHGSRPVT